MHTSGIMMGTDGDIIIRLLTCITKTIVKKKGKISPRSTFGY